MKIISITKINKRQKMLPAFFVALLFFFVNMFLFSPVAEAAINKEINYQGKLTNTSNIAVANGTYNMEFKLYTAGGATLWTETRTGGSRVQVSSGLFSVMLGEVSSLSAVDFNQTLYLGVNIGGTGVTPSWDGEMTPRKKLGVVPAAIEAERASTAIKSTNLIGGNSTNLLGSIPYQSDTDTTSFVSPNITITKKFFSMTGTGTNGAAPLWESLVAGDVGLGNVTNESKTTMFTAPTFTGNTLIAGNLTVDTNTLFVDSVNHNVGIGTTTPSKKLSISSGNIGVTAGFGLVWENDANRIMTPEDNVAGALIMTPGVLRVMTGGTSEKFRISSDGNVGIGTISPTTTLDIVGDFKVGTSRKLYYSGTGSLSIQANEGGGWSNNYNFLGQSGNVVGGFGVLGNGDSLERFYIGTYSSDEKISILENGRVGIGTTTPGYKLDIVGTGLLLHAGDTSYSAGEHLIAKFGPATTDGSVSIGYQADGITDNYGIVRSQHGVDLGLGAGAPDHLYIKQGGNVGIGITNPGAKLDVNGTSWFRGSLYVDSINHYSGSSPLSLGTGGLVNILTNGNVGIGTNNPLRKLVISGPDDGNPQLRLMGTADTVRWWDIGRESAVTGRFKINEYNNGAETERLTILMGGNVGIGKTNPGALLQVGDHLKLKADGTITWGNQSAQGELTWSPGVAYVMGMSGQDLSLGANGIQDKIYIKSDGNVGVGTTTPEQKLHVNGSIVTNGFAAAGNGLFFRPGFTSSNIYNLSITTRNLSGSADSLSINAYGGITFVTGTNDDTGERVRIQSNGNVGIGTTSPNSQLDLYSAGQANSGAGSLRLTSTNLANENFIRFDKGGSNWWVAGQENTGAGGFGDGNDFAFYSAGGAGWTMVMKGLTGNVGIGETSPSYKLDVAGSIGADGAVYSGGYSLGDSASDNMLTNGDFEMGLTGWGGFTSTTTTSYSGGLAGIATGDRTILSEDFIPVNPLTDVLQLEGWFKKTNDGANPGLLYFGYIAYDQNKNGIYTSPCGTYCYFAASSYSLTNDGSWHRFNATTTGEGTSYPQFPVGTKYVKVLVLINYSGSSDTATAVDHITLRRINNGPLFVGNNFTGTGMADHNQLTKMYTTASSNFIIEPYLNGNVGIGTTSPGAKLDVVGIVKSNVSNTGTLHLGMDSNENNYVAAGVEGTPSPSYDHAGKLSFKVLTWGAGTDYGLTEQMSIDVKGSDTKAATISMLPWGGRVGIGTTSPQKILDVVGGANNFVTVGARLLGTGEWTGIHFGYREDNISYRKSAIVFERADTGYGDGSGSIHILNDGSGTSNSADLGDARLTINRIGNVGIGTTNPLSNLDIGGSNPGTFTISSGGAIDLKLRGGSDYNAIDSQRSNDLHFQISSATKMLIQGTTGNVGIGTDTPGSRRLSVNTSAAVNDVGLESIILRTTGSNYAGRFLATGAGGTENFGLYVTASGAANNYAAVFDGGNVGIGDTSPSVKLDVTGRAFVDTSGTYSTSYVWGGSAFQTNSLEIMDRYNGSTSDGVYPTIIFHDYGNGGAQFSMEGSTTTLHLGSGISGSAGTLGGAGSYFSKLKVWGGVETTGYLSTDGVIRSGLANNVLLGLSSNVTNRASLTLNSTTGNPADIIFKNGSTSLGNFGQWAISSRNGSNDYRFSIWRGVENGGVSSESEVFSISSSGNVGIGVNTPDAKLTIHDGNMHLTSSSILGTFTTINPSHSVAIQGASAAGNYNSDDRDTWVFKDPYTGGNWGIYSRNIGTTDNGLPGNSIGFIGNTSLKAFIGLSDGNGYFAGNLGIGITTPGNILTIQQTSATDPIADAWTTYSSGRWKENRVPIVNILDKINELNPVYFDWTAEHGGSHDLGFIAEEMGLVIPEVVAWEENGIDAKSIDYARLSTIAIAGIKEMNLNIGAITGTIIPTPGSQEEIFANNFFDNIFAKVGSWLGEIDNGLEKIFVKEIRTKKLCVLDEEGVETCVIKSQLDALLASAGESDAGSGDDGLADGDEAPFNPKAPVVSLNGEAVINLIKGDTYEEQGATVTDDVDVDLVAIISGEVDTSIVGSYTLSYIATDTEGYLSIPVTRTVNVEEPAVPASSSTPSAPETDTNTPPVPPETTSDDVSGVADTSISSESTTAGDSTLTTPSDDAATTGA